MQKTDHPHAALIAECEERCEKPNFGGWKNCRGAVRQGARDKERMCLPCRAATALSAQPMVQAELIDALVSERLAAPVPPLHTVLAYTSLYIWLHKWMNGEEKPSDDLALGAAEFVEWLREKGLAEGEAQPEPVTEGEYSASRGCDGPAVYKTIGDDVEVVWSWPDDLPDGEILAEELAARLNHLAATVTAAPTDEMPQTTLLERLADFERNQLRVGDEYGAEVLHYAQKALVVSVTREVLSERLTDEVLLTATAENLCDFDVPVIGAAKFVGNLKQAIVAAAFPGGENHE